MADLNAVASVHASTDVLTYELKAVLEYPAPVVYAIWPAPRFPMALSDAKFAEYACTSIPTSRFNADCCSVILLADIKLLPAGDMLVVAYMFVAVVYIISFPLVTRLPIETKPGESAAPGFANIDHVLMSAAIKLRVVTASSTYGTPADPPPTLSLSCDGYIFSRLVALLLATIKRWPIITALIGGSMTPLRSTGTLTYEFSVVSTVALAAVDPAAVIFDVLYTIGLENPTTPLHIWLDDAVFVSGTSSPRLASAMRSK